MSISTDAYCAACHRVAALRAAIDAAGGRRHLQAVPYDVPAGEVVDADRRGVPIDKALARAWAAARKALATDAEATLPAE